MKSRRNIGPTSKISLLIFTFDKGRTKKSVAFFFLFLLIITNIAPYHSFFFFLIIPWILMQECHNFLILLIFKSYFIISSIIKASVKLCTELAAKFRLEYVLPAYKLHKWLWKNGGINNYLYWEIYDYKILHYGIFFLISSYIYFILFFSALFISNTTELTL